MYVILLYRLYLTQIYFLFRFNQLFQLRIFTADFYTLDVLNVEK